MTQATSNCIVGVVHAFISKKKVQYLISAKNALIKARTNTKYGVYNIHTYTLYIQGVFYWLRSLIESPAFIYHPILFIGYR